ncbi:hypothetical protein ACJ41O_014311 [Fusarium nematophilum]
MHLDHKIPWKTAAFHFNLTSSATGGNFDLVALNLPSESSTLGHCSRVFSATIKEFSATELRRVQSVQSTTQLFSDDVLVFPERHFGLGPYGHNSALHNPLSSSHQDLRYWQRRAGVMSFSTADADLGDAVKMLVVVAAVASEKALRIEALSALLQLAAHVPISQLRRLSWGHGFGTDFVAGVALKVYVHLNLTEAVQCRQKEQVSLLNVEPVLHHLSGHALQDYDYPAQNVPHRAFWNSLGVTDLWAGKQLSTNGRAGIEDAVIDPLAPDDDEIHQQARNRLQKYLKDCFAILYVYDVVLRQACGPDEAEEFWASEIVSVFRMLGCRMGDD